MILDRVAKDHNDRVPTHEELRDKPVFIHGSLPLLGSLGPHFTDRLHHQIAVPVECSNATEKLTIVTTTDQHLCVVSNTIG